jgi:hypothetical protein
MNKRGGPMGPRRGDRKRFPYEARIVSGRLVTPAELQTIHRFVLDTAVIEVVPDEVGAVVESVWPELVAKLPPRTATRGPQNEEDFRVQEARQRMPCAVARSQIPRKTADASEHGGDLGGAGGRARKETGERGENRG